MTTPSDDEGLRMVRDDKPRPRLFQEGISASERDVVAASTTQGGRFFNAKRIAATLGIVAAAIIVGLGVIYWKASDRYPVVVAIGLPDGDAQGDPLANRSGPLVPVEPAMLQVTSIALGEPRLAIVNGRPLAEGEWMLVDTRLGAASVRVIAIQDGLVRFRHGGETIDVKLQAAKQTKP